MVEMDEQCNWTERKNMQNHKQSGFATIILCAICIAAATVPGLANIVSNGDFEAGNTGFTSDYVYFAPGPNALFPEGVYTVDSNPQFSHPGFTSMSDHTDGGTLMMIVNGNGIPGNIVWQGTVTEDLTIGENYDFSIWVTNVSAGIPACMIFSADGVESSLLIPTNVGVWQRLTATFTATTVRPVLKLRNQQVIVFGNDFAMDDINIFFQGTTTVPDSDPNMTLEQDGSDIASGGSYNYGDVLRDQSATVVYTIKNQGNGPLHLSGSPFVSISGDAAFSVVSQPTSPVAAGGSTTFSVQFAPTDTGVVNATMSIASDDPTNNPYTVALSGHGIFPFIEIYSSAIIQDGDVTPSVDDSTDFGLRHIPDGAVTRTFYVENVGNAALVLSTPGVVLIGSSDFSVSTQVSPLTIIPGDKKAFAVTYTPNVNDTVLTTLSLAHNSDDSPYTFAMQGIGGIEDIELTAATDIQNGDMNPTQAKGTDFGDVYTRETQDTLSMTIKNTGNWPLTLTGIASSNSPVFWAVIDPQSPLATGGIDQLDPDSSLVFKVVFDPETDGPDSSLITILSSDVGETPFTYKVKGEGTWLGSIKATVWYDRNANGAIDTNEEGMKDILVLLNKDGDAAAYDKHLTNAGGWVKFNGLQGGEYVVNVDESTLPEGGVCTTGSLSKTGVIGEYTQISEAKFGIFWEDTTSINDHISDTKLPWDADLVYHSGSPEFAKEPWSNAVDKDLFGWDGTATVGEDENGEVWGVFEVEDGPCQFNRVTVVASNGPEDNNFHFRQVQELDIYISTTGPDSADFSYAVTVIIDNAKVWPPIYKFERTFVARYVKIVIVRPDLDTEWRQITEFALGELDEALMLDKRTVKKEAIELPTEYSLGQNYPNPFNPATNISYTLPDEQHVDIAIFNIKGDLVKQLVSGHQEAGLYTISWDATNQAGQKATTGVYFYRIKAGTFTDTKKMTLMQ